jgi:hypothetical protein
MPDICRTLIDLLPRFKREEQKYLHTAVMLAGDSDSQKILSTWSTLPVSWKDPSGPPPEDDRLLWDWIWGGTGIDWDSFSDRSGIALVRLKRLFEPLRANRLLYPDGTLAEHTEGFLKAVVVKAMPRPRGK